MSRTKRKSNPNEAKEPQALRQKEATPAATSKIRAIANLLIYQATNPSQGVQVFALEKDNKAAFIASCPKNGILGNLPNVALAAGNLLKTRLFRDGVCSSNQQGNATR